MREIFSELYKKVLGFFQAQDKEETETKTVAVNRMKLVLMQDRTNLTPFLLERMRGEMIEVLAKYVEMDKEALELNFEQEGDQMALMLSIPVIRAKDEEEIQAILDEEEKAKAEEEDEDSQSDEESEETDEDIEIVEDEEVCSNDEKNEDSESPDEEEVVEEETSATKSKKKN